MREGIKLLITLFLLLTVIMSADYTWSRAKAHHWQNSALERNLTIDSIMSYSSFQEASNLTTYKIWGTIIPENKKVKISGTNYIKMNNIPSIKYRDATGDTIPVLTDFSKKTTYKWSDNIEEIRNSSLRTALTGLGVTITLLSLAILLNFRWLKSLFFTSLLISFGTLTGQSTTILVGPSSLPAFSLTTFESSFHIYADSSTIFPGYKQISKVSLKTPEECLMSALSERDSSWTKFNTHPETEVNVQDAGYYTDKFKSRVHFRLISKVLLTAVEETQPEFAFVKTRFSIDNSANGPVIVTILRRDGEDWKLFNDGSFYEFQVGYSYLNDARIQDVIEYAEKSANANPVSLADIGRTVLKWLEEPALYENEIRQYTTNANWN